MGIRGRFDAIIPGMSVLGSLLLAWLALPPPGLPSDAALSAEAARVIRLGLGRAGPAALDVRAERFAQMTPRQLQVYLAGLRSRHPDPLDRLRQVTRRYLDTPYMASPLGEGRGHPPDEDPIFRLDGVDCTTFVEQAMAMVQARDLADALWWLRRIRYQGGQMNYSSRKHFMMAQWIPANQRLGLLQDITAAVAGERTRWVEKRLDREVWSLRRDPDKWPQLAVEQVPEGLFRLPLVPLDEVLQLADRIPSGTLVNIVRNDLRTVPTRVTHQGFLIVKRGRPFLRHAGRSGYGRVVDEPLAHFVARNQAYRKWRVDGFNLQRIVVDGISAGEIN